MPDGQLAALAVDLQLHREPGIPQPGDQRGDVGEARLRRELVAVVAAQHPDQPAHLGERTRARPARSSTAPRRVDSCSASITRRSAPACTTIIETWCAIASCSSRAIRARSSTTASRRARSRSRSASPSWRSRRPTMIRRNTMTRTTTAVKSPIALQLGRVVEGGQQVRRREDDDAGDEPRPRRPHRERVEGAEPAHRDAPGRQRRPGSPSTTSSTCTAMPDRRRVPPPHGHRRRHDPGHHHLGDQFPAARAGPRATWISAPTNSAAARTRSIRSGARRNRMDER